MVKIRRLLNKSNGETIDLPIYVEIDETKSEVAICFDIISKLADELERIYGEEVFY